MFTSLKSLLLFALILVLVACAPAGRYSQRHDSAPVRPPSNTELQDAKVNHEPVGRGNLPYTVFGKDYVPMRERQPYVKEGVASWYGKKFHGHLTSNGEVYDMYGMSAAHKTLPLPSYVKVTNLSNNKSVVVRVNDRGPFHQDRIIDLSYSAAYKIGVYDTGTAKVKVEAILPGATPKQFQITLTGFESQSQAEESGKGLSLLLNNPVRTLMVKNQHTLMFGPFDNEQSAQELLNKIKGFGYPEAKLSVTN